MKQDRYKIHINNPCKKEWDSLTQSDNGKYCSTCSTKVVDFTRLTDTEIIEMVSGHSGRLCARLTDQQINNVLVSDSNNWSSRLSKILSGIFLLSLAGSSFSFGTDIKRQLACKVNGIITNQQPNELTRTQNVVEGLVIDQTKFPLQGVFIIIKGTKIRTITDINGKFQLTIPPELLKSKIILSTRFIGYNVKEILVDINALKEKKELLIIMDAAEMSIGEVIVTPLKKLKNK